MIVACVGSKLSLAFRGVTLVENVNLLLILAKIFTVFEQLDTRDT